jgi:hypothetical protein
MKRRVAQTRSLGLRLFTTDPITSGRENRGAIPGAGVIPSAARNLALRGGGSELKADRWSR